MLCCAVERSIADAGRPNVTGFELGGGSSGWQNWAGSVASGVVFLV
jgi:hypothetical protein